MQRGETNLCSDTGETSGSGRTLISPPIAGTGLVRFRRTDTACLVRRGLASSERIAILTRWRTGQSLMVCMSAIAATTDVVSDLRTCSSGRELKTCETPLRRIGSPTAHAVRKGFTRHALASNLASVTGTVGFPTNKSRRSETVAPPVLVRALSRPTMASPRRRSTRSPAKQDESSFIKIFVACRCRL
jgi:hypothetical protein